MVLVCTSCGRSHPIRTLSRIEAILDSDPAAAQASLDSIDATTLKGRHLARYAMLKTQADYKCYVDIPSDSLIRIATDWYGTRHKDWHAAMSWYSLGCVSDLNGNDTIAIDAYLKALSLFPDTTVRPYILCEHNLGQSYMYHHQYEKAVEMLQLCLSNSAVIGDTITAFFATFNIAKAFMYMQEYSRSDSLFNTILQSATMPNGTEPEIYKEKAKNQLYGFEDYDSALWYIDKAISLEADTSMLNPQYSIKGSVFYALGILDSAYLYYSHSLHGEGNFQTKSHAYRQLAELAIRLQKTDDAIEYIEKYKESLHQVYEGYHLNAIDRIQSHYDDELRRAHAARVRNNTIIALVLLAVFATILTVRLYRKKVLQIRNAYFAEYQNALQALKADKTTELTNRIQECAHAFKDSSCHTLLLTIIDEKRNASTEERAQIVQELSAAFHDIERELRFKASGLSDDEITYCLLTAVGLNSVQCGYVLFGYSNLRMLKKRIKSKMPEELNISFFGEDKMK